jgi:predicted transcriptional regulator
MAKTQHRSEILELIFPKVRARILRLLFAGSSKARYVSELCRLTGFGLSTVQEELATLLAIGLLSTHSNGYHRFYVADSNHPLFPDLSRLVSKSARLTTLDISKLRRVARKQRGRKRRKVRARYPEPRSYSGINFLIPPKA